MYTGLAGEKLENLTNHEKIFVANIYRYTKMYWAYVLTVASSPNSPCSCHTSRYAIDDNMLIGLAIHQLILLVMLQHSNVCLFL